MLCVDDKDFDQTGMYKFLSQFSLCVLTAGGSVAVWLKRYWEAVELRYEGSSVVYKVCPT